MKRSRNEKVGRAPRVGNGEAGNPAGSDRMDDLVRLCPLTALAVAADLVKIPSRPVRPCTGLTEDELMCGYAKVGLVTPPA